MEQRINAEGWVCPKPIIETKRMLDTMREGTVITTVDNDIALHNLENFAASLGYEVSHTTEGNLFHVSVRKERDPEAEAGPGQSLAVLVSSDVFGQGARELGENLMKSYIYALTEAEPRPEVLMFINSGVFLTTEGSEVLESLRTLEAQGTKIFSCGACMNFYGVAEKLMIGEATNMYAIVENLHRAGNAIKV